MLNHVCGVTVFLGYTSNLLLFFGSDWPHRPATLWPRVYPPACVLLPVLRHPDGDQQRQGSSRSLPGLLLWTSGRTLLHVKSSRFCPKTDTERNYEWRVLFGQKDHSGAACLRGFTLYRMGDLLHGECTDGDSHVAASKAQLFCLNYNTCVPSMDALWGQAPVALDLTATGDVTWREVPEVRKQCGRWWRQQQRRHWPGRVRFIKRHKNTSYVWTFGQADGSQGWCLHNVSTYCKSSQCVVILILLLDCTWGNNGWTESSALNIINFTLVGSSISFFLLLISTLERK